MDTHAENKIKEGKNRFLKEKKNETKSFHFFFPYTKINFFSNILNMDSLITSPKIVAIYIIVSVHIKKLKHFILIFLNIFYKNVFLEFS